MLVIGSWAIPSIGQASSHNSQAYNAQWDDDNDDEDEFEEDEFEEDEFEEDEFEDNESVDQEDNDYEDRNHKRRRKNHYDRNDTDRYNRDQERRERNQHDRNDADRYSRDQERRERNRYDRNDADRYSRDQERRNKNQRTQNEYNQNNRQLDLKNAQKTDSKASQILKSNILSEPTLETPSATTSNNETWTWSDLHAGIFSGARRLNFNTNNKIINGISLNELLNYETSLIVGRATIYIYPLKKIPLQLKALVEQSLFIGNQDLSAKFMRWNIEPGYSVHWNAFTFTVSVGYATLAYTFPQNESSMNPDPVTSETFEEMIKPVPDVIYKYFNPGFSVSYKTSDSILFHTHIEGMYLRQSGEIQQINYYGGSTVLGLSANAGLTFDFTDDISLYLQGEIIHIGHDFNAGEGRLLDPDADGIEDIGGVLDQYFGLYAGIKYQI